jgi:hypothetical protein
VDKEKDDPCRIQESSSQTTETNIGFFTQAEDLFQFHGMGGGSHPYEDFFINLKKT